MSTAPDLPGLAPPAHTPRRARTASHLAQRAALAAVPELSPTPLTDAAAFDAALRQVAPRLQRYATRRLGDAHEAEEVVQEALLRACQHGPGFATEDDLMAWSTVVTGRLVIDRLRLRGRSVSVAEIPDNARTGRDTADVVVARDEARAALDALEAMPGRQAAVLWAREVEGLSYDEIADRFALSEPTVRSLLHRARRTLRREYAARGGTLPVAGLAVLAPWRAPLHGLSRLHAVARQAVTASSVTAAALSLTLGVLVLGLPHTNRAIDPRPAVVTTVAAHGSSASTHTPHARRAVDVDHAGSGAHSSPAHAGAGRAAPATKTNLGHRLIDGHKVCTPAPRNSSATRAGLNCMPYKDTPVLVVSIPLPKTPSDVHTVGVTSDKVDCTKLPKIPFTQCTSTSQSASTSSKSQTTRSH